MSKNETPCLLSGDKAEVGGQEMCSRNRQSKDNTTCGECTNSYFRTIVSMSELGQTQCWEQWMFVKMMHMDGNHW